MKNKMLALCGFALLITPLAVTAQQFGDFTYTSDGATITITGYTGPGGAVTIPDTIQGLPVVSIGDRAFYNSTLSSVTFPGSLNRIGEWTFSACNFLVEVTIPDGVTSIGEGAFSGCINLKDATIPGSLTNIGYAAFSSCGLTNVAILEGLTRVADEMFSFCFSLQQVTLPNSVGHVGALAFHACTSLTNIAIGSGLASFGENAFLLSQLTSFTVSPDNAAYSSADGVLFDKTRSTLVLWPVGRAGSYTIPARAFP